jgi:hypothetical protein
MKPMTLEQAKNNLQVVLDQLRMTKVERDVLDGSLRLLYTTSIGAEEMERELKDVRDKPTCAL